MKNTRREKLEALGYVYPLGWNEMSSSAKDRWEGVRIAKEERAGRWTA